MISKATEMCPAQATLENRDVTEPGQPYFEDAKEGCL